MRLIKVLYFDQSEGGAFMHWAPVVGQWCLRLHGVAILALSLMPAALIKLYETSVLLSMGARCRVSHPYSFAQQASQSFVELLVLPKQLSMSKMLLAVAVAGALAAS